MKSFWPLGGDQPTIKELIDHEMSCGIVPEPEPMGNRDEVTVLEMKRALDNPSLGIKVLAVRSPREIGAAAISWGKPEFNREIREQGRGQTTDASLGESGFHVVRVFRGSISA